MIQKPVFIICFLTLILLLGFFITEPVQANLCYDLTAECYKACEADPVFTWYTPQRNADALAGCKIGCRKFESLCANRIWDFIKEKNEKDKHNSWFQWRYCD